VGILVVDRFGLTQQVSTDLRGNYRAVVRAGSVRVDVIESTLLGGPHANDRKRIPRSSLSDPATTTATTAVGYGRGLVPQATTGTTPTFVPTVVPTAGRTRTATPTRTAGATPTPTPAAPLPTAVQECRTLDAPVELVPALELAVVTETGELFFTQQLCVTVEHAVVLLSAPDPESAFVVDDRITLEVERPDGSIRDLELRPTPGMHG
jgi:hypothetical protein